MPCPPAPASGHIRNISSEIALALAPAAISAFTPGEFYAVRSDNGTQGMSTGDAGLKAGFGWWKVYTAHCISYFCPIKFDFAIKWWSV